MSPPPLTIWAEMPRGIPGKSQTNLVPLGSEDGIRPENVVLVADRWGSATAKFDLRRRPHELWPDLQAFTPISVEIGGLPAWSGRLMDTPTREGEHVLSVQAEGWQAHLDDQAVERFYIHSRLADWKDTRQVPGCTLGGNGFPSGYTVSNEQGQIVLALPQGSDAPPGSNWVGVTLDLGPGQAANAISLDWDSANNTSGNVYVYARATSSKDPRNHGGAYADAFTFAHNTGASGTTTGTFSTGYRYVHVFMYFDAGAGGPIGADHWFRIKEARVFAASGYRSGAASVLKASQIIADVAQFPELLSSDLSGIQASSFSIPEYAPRAGRTPREHITAANAYEDWQAMVDVDRRLVYRPLPTAPTMNAGSAPGFTFDDTSANSGEEIYNAARIEAEQPDGTPLRFLRAGAGDTLADERGFTRAKTLPVRSTLTQAAAERIADKWLEGRAASPLKGKATVTGAGAVRGIAGEPVPPHVLLRRTGELLCLDRLVDPVTGNVGRNGRIASVTYTHAEDRAEVDIDNSRATFDALLARFDAIAGAR